MHSNENLQNHEIDEIHLEEAFDVETKSWATVKYSALSTLT